MVKKVEKSILPKPNMNYDTIHLIIAYAIFGLAILGIWKLVEIINWFK